MVSILVPAPLRSCTNGLAVVEADGETVTAVMDALVREYPRLKPQLFDDAGVLRNFVNLFLNDRDVRMIDGQASAVRAGDTIEILPAIAGGMDPPRDFLSWRKDLESSVTSVTPAELTAKAEGGTLILDVRGIEEWDQGHLPGATHLDRGFLELRIESVAPDLDRPIVCYCQSGTRSLFAAATLAQMGYRQVRSLAGGIQRWKAEGGAIRQPAKLSPEAQRRYQRHLAIPEIGPVGQQLLGSRRVLLIGAGGLGCPVALYLCAAGVGELTLVDDDVVEESNLQRQILYTPEMVGKPKAECAREVLTRFNPLVKVNALQQRLDEESALDMFGDFDLIVDGTDNFRSRYLINDAAVACGKAVVQGAIYRFNGQVSVFGLGGSACYRCLYPEAPPPELAPSCAEGGVLGILPGAIGMIMATEAIKLLLGIGRPLANRMVHFDAVEARFRELVFERRPDCPACGGAAVERERADAVAAAAG